MRIVALNTIFSHCFFSSIKFCISKCTTLDLHTIIPFQSLKNKLNKTTNKQTVPYNKIIYTLLNTITCLLLLLETLLASNNKSMISLYFSSREGSLKI